MFQYYKYWIKYKRLVQLEMFHKEMQIQKMFHSITLVDATAKKINVFDMNISCTNVPLTSVNDIVEMAKNTNAGNA
ncbi:hypothetical protein DERP_006651 [Dermatophagoides pteronyssinus]|uniref:Uncharacterized protein n=1 Tax=Dermatophagoides pteronyssinus TaxID=6956 RepID=A0ABQ8IQS6_DERPT|nr:hypothetical protein DERP_006651 [Dermatophagoides pteronyssinus]